MSFIGNYNDGSRRHTSEDDFFHGVNSFLYKVYPMPGILLKVFNVFPSGNFMITSIRCIRKSTKNRCNTDRKQQKIQDTNRSKDREIELINEV